VNDSDAALRKALEQVDWEKLLPGLIAYASHRLRRAGWTAGRDEEPSKLSVEQLVHTAVEHALDGSRVWNPQSVDLIGFLRGIIRSLTSSERKKYVRAKTVTSSEAVERHAGVTDSAEDDALEEEHRLELMRLLESCTDDDSDLQELYLVILDGHTKRDDIASSTRRPSP
jgi:DNA-directed RNA polymerase specialized sigma24 family protein